MRKHAESFGECPLTAEKHLESFKTALELCRPVLFAEYDDFGFNRDSDLTMMWGSGNVTPNYLRILNTGFDGVKEQIKQSISNTHNIGRKKYGRMMLSCIDLCLDYSDRFRDEIKDKNDRLYKALLKVPHGPAESFYEACVFIKLCIFFLRLIYTDHIGLGRFDQYMYGFFLADKRRGVSCEELFETLENFFISLNFDTDLYWGMQQGDNGQSMVLGGFDVDGNYLYNELSEMCMKASLELCIIDPKINLRVGKNTPEEVFESATLLTKQGLGFPQYCNDDVVIPGLIKLGYDKHDAYDYVVAACWEFIVPNCGADTPNYHLLDFPLVIGNMIKNELCESKSFDELMEKARLAVANECERLLELGKIVVRVENPLLSVFMDGCIESLLDTWSGGTKYRNLGSHGVGISSAADALAAIKKNVFDEKTISAQQLTDALEMNFEGCEEIRNLLLDSPKMGNNDAYVDSIASELMASFSKHFNNKPNIFGGIWRAGTGSAQNYVYASKTCPATADGRRSGQPYPSSFSPSLETKSAGLLSVIQSFTKYDLSDIINGGPLTIEIHDSVLRNDIGIKKTAQLVKKYIEFGGHQLQLNSVNREKLIDAQKHPENHKNLIVRVWGWSGYFNELDVEFQDHIIKRCEYII
ncbi:MAG: pyruvate formate-lyase [Clostridia bacterium]|nr:pyruvate formate-lyase [Clostridia bacterium]